MKTFTAVFLCSMAVAFSGCSDDTASGPDEPEETLLGSATIGSAGGDLTADNFVLSVPSGAFAGSASLELYELNDSTGFGSNTVSPLYRLDGLPDTFSESLYVAIKHNEALTGESNIACGRQTESAEGDYTQIVYSLLPIHDSSGFLVALVPPRNDSEPGATGLAARASNGGNKDFIAGITGQGIEFITPLFTIHRPLEDLIWSAVELKSYIETPYNLIIGMGLEYELRDWRWPGQLIFVDMPYNRYTFRRPDDVELEIERSGKKAPVLNLNDVFLSGVKRSDLCRGLAKAMLSIAQSEADPIGWGEYITDNSYGWHMAVRQWFQEKVSDPASFIRPSAFSGCETFPFNGLEPNQNGCGMSPFVKYLAETEGDAVIGRIYEHIRDGQMFVDAILNSTSEPVYNWLPEFFDRYIRGTYYGVSSAALIASPAGSFTIDSDADTLQSFYRGCPELGAQIYRINLDYDSISSSATLNLTLEGSGINPDYLTVLLYKYKDNTLTYLDAGHAIDLGDLHSLTNDGYDLIAVVVNSYGDAPYTGTSALTLTVHVTSSLVLDYPRCRVRLTGITGLQSWRNTVTGETGSTETSFNAQFVGTGSFVDDTFQGSWDETVSGYRSVGSMSVTVDPVARTVTAFSASETITATDYIYTQTIAGISGKHLGMGTDTEVDLLFFKQGTGETCDYFTYSYHYELQQSQETWTHDLVATGCDDAWSTVAVEFYKDE